MINVMSTKPPMSCIGMSTCAFLLSCSTCIVSGAQQVMCFVSELDCLQFLRQASANARLTPSTA